MKTICFLFSFFNILLCLLPVQGAASDGLPDAPHLTINGEATLHVQPDRLTMNMAVTEAGTDTKKIRTSVENRSSQLIDSLLKLGILKEDITAADLQITPHFNWSDQQQTYRGTEVSRQLRIILRDISLYDAFMKAVTSAGITRILNTTLSVSNEKELEEKLMKLAVADGIRKGTILAEELGRKLGPVYSAMPQDVGMPLLRARYMAAESATSSFEPGMLTLNHGIKLVFLLKDK